MPPYRKYDVEECGNCMYFRQHYVKIGADYFSPISYGHISTKEAPGNWGFLPPLEGNSKRGAPRLMGSSSENFLHFYAFFAIILPPASPAGPRLLLKGAVSEAD